MTHNNQCHANHYFCVNLFIESGALVMTAVDAVVVVLWFNVPVNIYGHFEFRDGQLT